MLDERPAPEDGTADATATADLLRQAGKTLISTVGGASGPLYGTAFLRGGRGDRGGDRSVGGRPRSSRPSRRPRAGSRRSASRRRARRRCSTRSSRRPGRRAPRSTAGATCAAVTAAARDAAAAGAAATIPMLATKGRASYLGERSVGHQDPGATSSALLLAVLAETAAAGTSDPAAATA